MRVINQLKRHILYTNISSAAITGINPPPPAFPLAQSKSLLLQDYSCLLPCWEDQSNQIPFDPRFYAFIQRGVKIKVMGEDESKQCVPLHDINYRFSFTKK